MADGFTIPCGFGPPGELPQTLPPGVVDGGVIVIPTPYAGAGVEDLGTIYIGQDPPTTAPPPGPDITIGDPPVVLAVPAPQIVVCNINVAANVPVNVSCVVTNTVNQTFVLQDTANFNTTWNLLFNNLTPNTFYAFKLLCTENSFFHKSTLVTGSFITKPLTNAPVIPPDFIPPSPSSVPIIPPDTNPSLPPSPSSAPVIPPDNNNPTPTPIPVGVINNLVQGTLQMYSNFLFQSNNSLSQIDLKYTPYTITPTKFTPAFSESYSNIFDRIRHKSIQNIIDNQTTTLEIINLDNRNITTDHIKKSLRSDLRSVLFNLKYPNNIKVKEDLISNSILNHLRNSTLNYLDVDYLLSLQKYASVEQTTVKEKSNILKSNYGNNVSKIKSSRIISQPSFNNNQTSAITKDEALRYLRKKLYNLDSRNYMGAESELLRLWYCLPTDINKRVDVQLQDGSLSAIYIEDTDTFDVQTSNGSVCSISVNINDAVPALDFDGQQLSIFTNSDIERSYSLTNSDEYYVMNALKIEKDISLEVSSPTNIELTSSVSSFLNTNFVLTLNTSTIEDKNSTISPYIIETEANYTLMTSAASAVNFINNEVKYRAYPWLVLSIDYTDPIWDYFVNSNSTANSFKLLFKDLTYRYIDSFNERYNPIIVRKIPRTILLVPTDKTKYNLYNAKSISTDWNVRKIRFTFSIDENLNTPGLLNHPFKIENTFLNSSGESKSGEYDTQAFHCKYSTNQANFNETFKDPNNKPTRLEDSLRKAVQIVSSLNENYNLNEGLTWYDVLSRLNRSEFYALTVTNTNTILNKLKTGDQTNVKIFHVRGTLLKDAVTRQSNTRILSQKEQGVEEFPAQYPISAPIVF